MDTNAQRELFEAIVGPIPQPAKSNLLQEFDRLAAIHADPAVTDKAPVEAEIAGLQRNAALASHQAPRNPLYLYGMIGLVVALSFTGLFSYFAALGPAKYILIETTRPVLVFTLILAMLGFGGALILTALFGDGPTAEFEKRFRLGREIFLVYSGIFGTIIGFYFGAASGEAANANPPTLSAVSVQADGMLTAQIEGGTGPFNGRIRLKGEDEDRSLIVSSDKLSIQLNAGKDCPAGAQLTVGDADSQSAELTVPNTAADLLGDGWEGCRDDAQEEAGDVAGGNASDNSSVDNAVENTG